MQKTSKKPYLVNGIDPYDFDKTACGKATIYSKKIPWATSTHVRFVFNLGAMHDDAGKEGTAHFLEHMLFSGTPLYPDKEAFDQFKKLYTLDTMNAFTSFSNLAITFRFLEEHTEKALEGTHDMIVNALLTDEAVEKERGIITQEAWGRYINEKYLAYRKKENANTYYDMPDRLRIDSPLGWPDTIQKITGDDLRTSRKKGLNQANLSVVVTGIVTPRIMKEIKKLVLNVPEGKKTKTIFVPKKMAAPKVSHWMFDYTEMGISPSKQANVILGGVLPKAYPLDHGLSDITENFMYELLFKHIRHKNSWCYRVGANYSDLSDFNAGQLSTRIDPAHVVETVKLISDIVDQVIEGKFEQEFIQEKNLCLERKKSVELKTSDVAEHAVNDLCSGSDVETRKKMFEYYEKVTFKDVQKLLKAVHRGHTRLIEIYVPEEVDKKAIKAGIKGY